MKSPKIVVAPHTALRQVAKPITLADKKVISFAKALGEVLQRAENPTGVGLAAPQVDTPWRIFVTHLDSGQSDQPFIRYFFNPRLVDRADRLVTGMNPRKADLEGCLSIPYLYGPVARPEWVTLEFQTLTETGELSLYHTETFFDFIGRVVQHELDHLDGILFTDHILTQGQVLYQEEKGQLVEIDPQIARAL